MKRNIVWIGIVALVASIGCGIEKGGVTPAEFVAPAPVSLGGDSTDLRPLSMVTGTWTGVETASVGQSGTLSVTFTQPPTPNDAVNANLTWTSAVTALTFHGTLTGNLGNMVINATDAPESSRCGYHAVGALNQAGTQITGSYNGTGPASCPNKAGTFVLNGQSYVPTCDEQHPPAASYVGFPTDVDAPGSGSNWTLSGSAKFDNAGTWEVRLYSASAMSEYTANTPDFTKDTATATVQCDHTSTKEVSYKWDGHPSEYWWLAIYKNGVFFSKSAVVTNTHN